MIENANRKAKAAKVEEIKQMIQESKSIVLVKYQGITVEQDTNLRKELRKNDVSYHVYKNTLVKRATNELGIEGLDAYLEGPTAFAFGKDETSSARIISNFIKDVKAMELKAGWVDGVVYDDKGINTLATIPSREVLISKFLGSIKSPISNLAYVLNAVAGAKGEGQTEEAAPAAE